MRKLLAVILLAGLAFAACQKEFSIENGQSGNLTGAWEFKDSANTLITGKPLQYYVDTTSNTASAKMVYTGTTANLSNISIEVFFPTGKATVGSYQSVSGRVNFNYTFSNSQRFYQVNGGSGQFSTENITVTITQITDTTVTGTFSGTALDSANRLVPIKEGKFSYRGRSIVTPPPAVSVGTLGTASDTCIGAVISGTYRKSTALTGANTVTLTVNVSTPGTYDISSDTLKGIAFKGTGSFTALGVQSVTLPGVGTPTDTAAALRFRVRYGTSNCTFLVKIDTAGAVVVPPTGDYFPLTRNSNWSYDYFDQTGTQIDSLRIVSTGTFKTVGANAFNIFLDSDGDSSFYRKNAGIYYEAVDLDNTILAAGGVQVSQILKDNVPVNNTWTDTYSNITIPIFPIPITVKIDYTLLEKAVPATVGSLSFTDVIKVKALVSYGVPGSFTPGFQRDSWYAKGVGIIYLKESDPTSPGSFTEQKLRRFTIF